MNPLNYTKMIEVPQVGQIYHFFDDGKMSKNRHYKAECLEVITPEEAKKVVLEIPTDGSSDTQKASLYNIWRDNVRELDWMYAEETDYFVRCRVPDFDENDLWFVRTINNRWFSMDIQSWWQVGLLDVSNDMYEQGVKYFGEEYYKD